MFFMAENGNAVTRAFRDIDYARSAELDSRRRSLYSAPFGGEQ
jgi:hypothetical protein